MQQLDGIITNSDTPHLRSVFAEHGGEHGAVGVKNLALAEFLGGGAAVFFNTGEDLVATGADEHAGTCRDGQAGIALGCERAEQSGGDAFTGACEDLTGDDVFTAAAHELPGLAGGKFDLFAGAAEGFGQVGVFDAFGLFDGNNGVVALGHGRAGHDGVGQVVGGAGTLQGAAGGDFSSDGEDAVFASCGFSGEGVAVHLGVVEAGYVHTCSDVLGEDASCRMVEGNRFCCADEDFA